MSINGLQQNPAALMMQAATTASPLGQASQLAGSMAQVLQSLSGLLQALAPLLQKLGGGQAGGMGMAPGAGALGQGMPAAPGGPLAGGAPTMMPALPGGMPGGGFPGTGMPPGGYGGAPNTGLPNGGIQAGTGFGGQQAAIPMDNDRAVRELARNFSTLKGGDEKISVKDLKAIAQGNILDGKLSANHTPELKAAAQHILNNPALLRQLDTADSVNSKGVGKADGKIGLGDINAMLQRTGPAVGEQQTLQTLAKYGDQLFNNSSKTFNKQDIQTIASTGKMPNGATAPADLQAAAKDLMARPELYNKLDNALKIRTEGKADQRGDGKVSVEDLKLAISGPQQMTTAQVKAPVIGQVEVGTARR
ncbi:HrpF/NolX family T3SS translocon protein [Aquabacterium sp. A7-Y]|uniref:HrpF/NolX family T3SS translocon protein n=1 Tax=Aquabacterium sp. A7-Y TaxID=1349605 RepID=UPI00223DB452|nr:HrpF/NolX family T3SS translocon protein [Aquabacterium sp. A7-Y]MCW7540281.1 HrpF/NolX family T3SS translocon protein [Aquabacterium sp. A7-Y]